MSTIRVCLILRGSKILSVPLAFGNYGYHQCSRVTKDFAIVCFYSTEIQPDSFECGEGEGVFEIFLRNKSNNNNSIKE